MLGITTSTLLGDLTNNTAQNLNFAVPVKYVRKAMLGEDINFTENSPDFLYCQGVIYENKNDYEKATTSFLKALRIDEKYAQAYVELGECYYKTGDYDREMKMLEAATALIGDDPDVFVSLAGACEDVGNYDAAITNYKKALQYRQDDKDALYSLCILEITKGDAAEARAYIAQLAKLNKGLGGEMNILLDRTK